MNVRRDRGVALPSPVAALSVVAIVVAALAFAVTGFSGDKNKDVTPQAASTSVGVTPTSTSSATGGSTPTDTATAAAFDKAKIHLSFYNNGAVTGLAADEAEIAKKAGWTDTAVGKARLGGGGAENVIYYAPENEAAAKQLGLDLGITKVITPDHPDASRIIVVMFTAPNG